MMTKPSRMFSSGTTSTGQPELSKAMVQARITHLQEQGVTASSIHQRLAAIRKWVRQATGHEPSPERVAQAMLWSRFAHCTGRHE
jgi:site-specific recombinase XerD